MVYVKITYKLSWIVKHDANQFIYLKSLGPNDRTFYGHGKNDGFVLYEYIIKQCVSFLQIYKYQPYKKKMKEKTISTVNRKYVMCMGNIHVVLYVIASDHSSK